MLIIFHMDKQIKLKIHEGLNKHGFYKLPLRRLTQILILLKMPLVKQARIIQQHTIEGLTNILQNRSSIKDRKDSYFDDNEFQQIGLQVKRYLSAILFDLLDHIPPQMNQPTPNQFLQANRLNQKEQAGQQRPIYLQQNINSRFFEKGKNQQQIPQVRNTYIYKPFEDLRKKMKKKNMFQLNDPLIQYQDNHQDIEYSQPKAVEIEIQTDLTLLNEQIEVFPIKQKKIKKEKKEKREKKERRQTKQKQTIQQDPISSPILEEKLNQQSRKASNQESKSCLKEDKSYFITLNQNQFNYRDLNNPTAQLQIKPPLIKINQDQLRRNMNEQKQFSNCVCRGQVKMQQSFQCYLCKNSFHYACLKYRKEQILQECPICRLQFIDPINEVRQTVGTYFIQDIKNKKFEIEISIEQYAYFLLKRIRSHEIEFRCLRLDGNVQTTEIVWPDEVFVTIDDKIAFQIQGICKNSSQKRRKDEGLILTSNITTNRQEYNKVKLGVEMKPLTNQDYKTKNINNSYIYLFGIYFIQKLTREELIKKFQVNLKPYSYDFINSLMNSYDEQIQIEKIVCTLEDPYSKNLLSLPVRGNKCLHGQCFDLRVFLSLIYKSKNRQWKCPMCNKKVKEFFLDKQILQIIKKSAAQNLIPNQLYFMKDGTVILKVSTDKDEEQEDDQQQAQANKKTLKVNPKSKKNKFKPQKIQEYQHKYKEIYQND